MTQKKINNELAATALNYVKENISKKLVTREKAESDSKNQKKLQIEKRNYRCTFLTTLLGTIPGDENIVKTFIHKKIRDEVDKGKLTQEEIEKIQKEELEELRRQEEEKLCGFWRDKEGNIIVLDYWVRGFIKNAANVLKEQLDVKKYKSKIEDFCFVSPREIKLLKNGQPFKTVDGIYQRPVPKETPYGQKITFLVSSEKIEPDNLTFDFTLTLFKNKHMEFEDIEEIMKYSQYCGYGQARGSGFGKAIIERID